MNEIHSGYTDKIRPYFLDDDPPSPRTQTKGGPSFQYGKPPYRAGIRFTCYWLMAMATSTLCSVAGMDSLHSRPGFVFIPDIQNLPPMLGISMVLFIISCLITVLPFGLLLALLNHVRPWLLYLLHLVQILIVMLIFQYAAGGNILQLEPVAIYGGMSVLYFVLFMEEWRKRDPEGYYK